MKIFLVISSTIVTKWGYILKGFHQKHLLPVNILQHQVIRKAREGWQFYCAYNKHIWKCSIHLKDTLNLLFNTIQQSLEHLKMYVCCHYQFHIKTRNLDRWIWQYSSSGFLWVCTRNWKLFEVFCLAKLFWYWTVLFCTQRIITIWRYSYFIPFCQFYKCDQVVLESLKRKFKRCLW